jgi:fructokinase
MNKRQHHAPTIYGTGFIALDLVVDEDSGIESEFAGGTCGNVLAIMAFFGWRSTAIARLAEDAAGTAVREDLEQWGVQVDHVGQEPQSATPIVVEQIYRNRAGNPRHRYVWTCPGCGGYLPQYRALLSKSVETLLGLPAPRVFFFDRVSRSSIDLARNFSDRGALVVFEPSGSSDPRLFREALRVCHILKYSSQRLRGFSDLLKKNEALLEIETLGDEGLRYRTTLSSISGYAWRHLPAFQVETVKDTAGCGDWCTAGLLSRIGAGGARALASMTPEDVERVLQYAQAFSAWNCRFPAARGGMYLMTRAAVLKSVERIIAGSDSAVRLRPVAAKRRSTRAPLFCPACAEPASRQRVSVRNKTKRAG